MITQTEALKLAASALKGSQEYKRGHATFVEAVEELEEALAEQPAPAAQQEPVAGLSETQAKAILVLALDLEKTGRAVAIAEGQERTDFVNRNRNIQCALEDALRNAATPQAQRKPLTDEQKYAMYQRYDLESVERFWYEQGVEDTEAAHGIEEKNA